MPNLTWRVCSMAHAYVYDIIYVTGGWWFQVSTILLYTYL